ncbi:testis-specific serine/threonine-protein kinase 4-like [Schistocerca piceifrons]|uniref:testis-specific serine/threonine-protein kinase 4-like n=1 Tax=Schistocerca piceifrons TaxID=274613 RepID=UPI001F5F7C5E|nr:testis-specific serine/threonine-protein kinase 4-like [Schistocerca piceifrons]
MKGVREHERSREHTHHRDLPRRASSEYLLDEEEARSVSVADIRAPAEDLWRDRSTVLERHGFIPEEVIGSGSYAVVKKAHSLKYNRDVAIKIISKFYAPSDYMRRFLPREIGVVQNLKHKNMVRFLHAIETTHRIYIVMEFAPNGSLLDVIQKDGHIDEVRSRHWFGQLVDVVSYIHSKRVVHRDIKCENLLMDAEMNVKLSDFGFARRFTPPSKDGPGSPLSETFCGSYAYAAPEILKGRPYRPDLSDIWSMGVVLYAMVFGRLPFDDSNYTKLLKQVQSRVVFPKEPQVSSACRLLITRILAPIVSRARLPSIRDDPWMALGGERGASTSSEDGSQRASTASEGGAQAGPSHQEPQPVPLVTKEALERAASKGLAQTKSDSRRRALATSLHTERANSDSDASPVTFERPSKT